ncbi:cyclin-dependent kinase inhibitor 1C isoform X1 [Etheostoma spectabile]|uniref:cyclin-dependent kinase inhibitor 1C isoform X1 n=1 Tax=Etheostoma spectabile TaxID=54343 RepID=UPI0013AF120F|nr:cyclin-dependent kinase inhibitor 1C-like isoform X1 [Etheostoma spectabile]
MEETLQPEKQESEYKNPNEDQGGMFRRLRDRDLLRKRKAEAEEKETNQWVLGMESQKKRPRAESGMKRRGRPKKSEPTPQISVIQEEPTVLQEAPSVVEVVPEPAEVIPDQTPGSLSPLLAPESQPSSVLAGPALLPVFGSIKSPVFAPALTSPSQIYPTPVLFSPSAPAPSTAKAPIPVQDSSPAPEAVPVPALTQAPVPAAAPPQVETFFTESQSREALNLIEDLGPDEEEDVSPCLDKRSDEELIETPLINVPEQNIPIPKMSSTPPPQKYFPGNLF